jgi:hypothetical protein
VPISARASLLPQAFVTNDAKVLSQVWDGVFTVRLRCGPVLRSQVASKMCKGLLWMTLINSGLDAVVVVHYAVSGQDKTSKYQTETAILK